MTVNMQRVIQTDAYKRVAGATITVGAVNDSANTCPVTIQLTDAAGSDIDFRGAVHFYLGGINGDTLSTAATSLAIGTDGLMIEPISNSYGLLVSEADGDIDIVVGGGTGAYTTYLNLVLPTGQLVTSGAIVFTAD
jgi:hypothetical protein